MLLRRQQTEKAQLSIIAGESQTSKKKNGKKKKSTSAKEGNKESSEKPLFDKNDDEDAWLDAAITANKQHAESQKYRIKLHTIGGPILNPSKVSKIIICVDII